MGKRASLKYEPLTAYLLAQRGDRVRMSFAEIERVIGTKLPPSAASRRGWWSNNPFSDVMAKAWLEAGFESEQVDLKGRKLAFRRASASGRSSKSRVAARSGNVSSGRAALFGWLQGTVAWNGDLTEPADPAWGERGDDGYALSARLCEDGPFSGFDLLR